MDNKKILIKEVFAESWQLVDGMKWPVLWLFSACLLMGLAVVFLESLIAYLVTASSEPGFIFEYFIAYPSFMFFIFIFSVVSTMLGVRKSIGLPISVSKTIAQCRAAIKPCFYVYLMWLFFESFNYLPDIFPALGKHLFVILVFLQIQVSIFVFVFLVPVIITKKCSFSVALKYSYEKCKIYDTVTIRCVFLMFLLFLLSLIPFGIGLIWTLPMASNMYGILFRDACGLKK